MIGRLSRMPEREGVAGMVRRRPITRSSPNVAPCRVARRVAHLWPHRADVAFGSYERSLLHARAKREVVASHRSATALLQVHRNGARCCALVVDHERAVPPHGEPCDTARPYSNAAGPHRRYQEGKGGSATCVDPGARVSRRLASRAGARSDDYLRLGLKEGRDCHRRIRSLPRQGSLFNRCCCCNTPRRYRAIKRVEVARLWTVWRASVGTELRRGLSAAAWRIEDQAHRDQSIVTPRIADLAGKPRVRVVSTESAIDAPVTSGRRIGTRFGAAMVGHCRRGAARRNRNEQGTRPARESDVRPPHASTVALRSREPA